LFSTAEEVRLKIEKEENRCSASLKKAMQRHMAKAKIRKINMISVLQIFEL